jgi:hypothetical protein
MNSYNYTTLSNLLFLDIEAVREYETFEQFCAAKNFENWKKVAAKHYADVLKVGEPKNDQEIYLQKAGLYAEYAKTVCIGLGRAVVDMSVPNAVPTVTGKLYDLTSHDEYSILVKLADQLERAVNTNPKTMLAGHNILEYDIPFLTKRMIKYKIKIPQILKSCIYGKPWEIPVLDTMRDWRMNTSKYMSMDTICEFMGIPSSKHGEVNGSTLGDYYWNNRSLFLPADERNDVILGNIAKYCKHDISNCIDICTYLSQV